MSFIANNERGLDTVYLCRLFPSIRITDWTLNTDIGPAAYEADLPANYVDSFTFNSSAFTLHTSLTDFLTPTADKYLFDRNSGKIYADFTGKGTVDLEDYIVANYEINFASKEISFFRDPTDDASEETPYFPNLSVNINTSKSIDNSLYGFMPSFNTQVGLTNVDYEIGFIIGSSNLSKKRIDIFAYSGDRDVSNVVRVFTGVVNSVNASQAMITLLVTDNTFKLDGNFSYSGGLEKFSADFSNEVDPVFQDTNVREVYGVVNNMQVVNFDYFVDGATVFNNNEFIVCKHYNTTLSDDTITATVVAGANTTTRTYLDSVESINVFDNLYQTNDASYHFDITAIDRDNNYIEHAANPAAATVGWELKRDRIGYLKIVSKNTGNSFRILRDGGSPGFSTSVDATNKLLRIDMTNADPRYVPDGADEWAIIARVYGEKHTETISGETFNQASPYGINTKWYQIIYEYLRKKVGLSEDEIDTQSFLDLEANIDNEYDCGFYVPNVQDDDLPSHKNVLLPVMSSNHASLFQNSEGKVSLYKINKFSTSDFSVNKDEIYTLSYSEDYIDTVSSISVNYRKSDFGGGREFETVTPSELFRQTPGFKTDTFQNASVSEIFESNNTQTIDSRLFLKSQAADLAEKLFYLYAHPVSFYTIELPTYYIDKNIGDVVTINLEGLFGFFDTSFDNEISGVIVGIDFTGSKVRFKILTQKGIQDSKGVW